MDIFGKWDWIKQNWPYVVEEIDGLGLVFVGGTALNLVFFDEYRASEDIDLYNPDSKGPDNPNGKDESETSKILSGILSDKGFKIAENKQNYFYIGPNIKVEIFNDGTTFGGIERKKIENIKVPVFDLQTYMQMKMAALLCRTVYDSRDLVDIFTMNKTGGIKIAFPDRECETIENNLSERISEIDKTSEDDLLLFQSRKQIDALPFDEFIEFKRWFVDWLSEFC